MIENLLVVKNSCNYKCYDFFNNSKHNIGNIKQVSIFFLSKDYLKGLYYTCSTVVLNCICGEFFIAILDLRKNSVTFNYLETMSLTSESCNSIFIPGGCAYGFIAVKPSVLLLGRTDYSNFESSIFPLSNELAIPWPVLNPIIDKCDLEAPTPSQFFIRSPEYLIFGATGFIGSEIIKILKKKEISFSSAISRLENYNDILQEISHKKPRYVICAAGISPITHATNMELMQKNLTGQLNVIQACEENKIHCTIFSSGNIYKSNIEFFTEEDLPNNNSSFFEESKILLECAAKKFNVLILRLQNPITVSMNSKNFLYRILSKKSVSEYQCTYTAINDLFPYIPLLCEKKVTGIVNFVSSGTVSENDIFFLYRSIVNSTHSWEIRNENNNNVKLNNKKLSTFFSDIPSIVNSIEKILRLL